ncbi:MAG: hypothetical protein JO061_03750 [Acidobacteriaceae bacterium]|nr:hypothetical protein [Acidobacteriaceae bacterium]
MERQLRTRGDAIQRLGSSLLRWTIGYGYDPQWAIWEIAGLSAVGWILYRRSYFAGQIVPTDKDAYSSLKANHRLPDHHSRFSPLIYSLENTFPIVKLGQTDRWQPDPHPQKANLSSEIDADPRIAATGRSSSLYRLFLRATTFAPKLLHFSESPQFIRWFIWIQILLGWLLATLFVAGVAGIVHKD